MRLMQAFPYSFRARWLSCAVTASLYCGLKSSVAFGAAETHKSSRKENLRFVASQSIQQSPETAAASIAEKDLYKEAKRRFLLKKFDEAEKIVSKLLEQNPQSDSLHALALRIEYARGDYEKAAQHAELLSLRGLDDDTVFEVGVTHFSVSACNRALRAFKQLPRSYSQASYARFYAGFCQIDQGRFDLARLTWKVQKDFPRSLKNYVESILRCVVPTN